MSGGKLPPLDTSDRKSLEHLTAHLHSLTKNTMLNQSSTRTPSPRVKKRSRRPTSDQTTKITSFFVPKSKSKATDTDRENPKRTSATIPPKTTKKLEKKPFESQSQNKSTKEKAKGTSATFDRYGLVLPTCDQILHDMRELDEYKRKLASLEEQMDKNPVGDVPQLIEEPKPQKLINCHSLTIDEIGQEFQRHRTVLDSIFHGTLQESAENPRTRFYSPALLFFTEAQKSELLRLMQLHFDDDLTKIDYFCQVLMPEVCIRIFMDTHKMGRDEVIRYMNEASF